MLASINKLISCDDHLCCCRILPLSWRTETPRSWCWCWRVTSPCSPRESSPSTTSRQVWTKHVSRISYQLCSPLLCVPRWPKCSKYFLHLNMKGDIYHNDNIVHKNCNFLLHWVDWSHLSDLLSKSVSSNSSKSKMGWVCWCAHPVSTFLPTAHGGFSVWIPWDWWVQSHS